MKRGTKVKMSKYLKNKLRSNGSKEHVDEFGDSIGVVQGFAIGPNGEIWPEVDVRWLPDNLRYAYPPEDLIVIL